MSMRLRARPPRSALAWIAATVLASSPPAFAGAAAAAGGPVIPRGPAVAVPDCRVMQPECGVDPDTPALDAHACAVDLKWLLERRGLTAHLLGTVEGDVCEGDPGAVVLVGTLSVVCPSKKGTQTARGHALSSSLRGDLLMRDCASGAVVGRGKAERAIEGGRARLLRDAVEELSHGLDVAKVRRSHPGTPRAWWRADAGGWHALELIVGLTDIEESDLNDYFAEIGLGREQYARRFVLEKAFYPWNHQRLRVAYGLDFRWSGWKGIGVIDLEEIHIDPARYPKFVPGSLQYDPEAEVEADLNAYGFRGSVGWGLDVTRHQRVSLLGTLGYYMLGAWPVKAEIDIEGVASDALALRSAAWGLGGELRWEWRFTPHLGLILSGGWDLLNFGEPNRVQRQRFFPVEVSFSGPSTSLGLVGRF